MLAYWYKDRDFPEVKTSNSDIVAVVENPKQLQRLIDDHNEAMEKLQEYYFENKRLVEELNNLRDMADHWGTRKDEVEGALTDIENEFFMAESGSFYPDMDLIRSYVRRGLNGQE